MYFSIDLKFQVYRFVLQTGRVIETDCIVRWCDLSNYPHSYNEASHSGKAQLDDDK